MSMATASHAAPLDDFLSELDLLDFKEALIDVTGLKSLEDMSQNVAEVQDLIELCEKHGMKKPQMRKLFAQLQTWSPGPGPMCALGVAEEVSEQKPGQESEQERLAAAKKRREQDKRRLKKERQAEEQEKHKKLEALAAVEAAEAAAAAAVEQARVDAKAAAAAQVEAQRLAKIAAKRSKKCKTEDLDDLIVLDLAIAANDEVAEPVAASKSQSAPAPATDVERAAQLRQVLKARQQLTKKGRTKVGKPKEEAAAPTAEEAANAARLATAAEVTRNRNIQKEREAYVQRLEAKNAELTSRRPAKPQQIAPKPMIERVEKRDPPQMLHDLELEIAVLEADKDTPSFVVLDRVTELMMKLDSVPVESAELRADRKNALARLDALADGLREGASLFS